MKRSKLMAKRGDSTGILSIRCRFCPAKLTLNVICTATSTNSAPSVMLLLAHSQDQTVTQKKIEAYLSAAPSLLGSDDDPKAVSQRVKLMELYILHVLPRVGDWEYAREFTQMSPDLDEEQKDVRLASPTTPSISFVLICYRLSKRLSMPFRKTRKRLNGTVRNWRHERKPNGKKKSRPSKSVRGRNLPHQAPAQHPEGKVSKVE